MTLKTQINTTDNNNVINRPQIIGCNVTKIPNNIKTNYNNQEIYTIRSQNQPKTH